MNLKQIIDQIEIDRYRLSCDKLPTQASGHSERMYIDDVEPDKDGIYKPWELDKIWSKQ
jgi:hypothetical protein